jgi:hypothetical protein
MATSFLSHGLVGIASFLTDSLSELIWNGANVGPSPSPPPVYNRSVAARADRIVSLPGLNDDSLLLANGGGGGGEQFAGYLEVAPTRHIFYWYMESQGDPVSDPVIFWSK